MLLLDLPNELLYKIFGYLTPKDLSRVVQCNRKFFEIVSSDLFLETSYECIQEYHRVCERFVIPAKQTKVETIISSLSVHLQVCEAKLFRKNLLKNTQGCHGKISVIFQFLLIFWKLSVFFKNVHCFILKACNIGMLWFHLS